LMAGSLGDSALSRECQHESDLGPLALPVHEDLATVQGDQGPRDRQAQPAPAAAAASVTRLALHEAVEDRLGRFHLDAGTVVAHRHADLRSVRCRIDRHFGSVRRGVHGVLEQVVQHL